MTNSLSAPKIERGTTVTTYISMTPFETLFLGDLTVSLQRTQHGLRTINYREAALDGTLSDPIRDYLCDFIDSIVSSYTHEEEYPTIYVRFVEQVNHDQLH